jgi:aminopeptidase YwaD
MNKFQVFAILLILFLPLSCRVYKYTADISETDLDHHIQYLASDALQGRYPGTTGDLIAGRYIQDQFRNLGLKPHKQDFSFLQAVKRGPDNALEINGNVVSEEAFAPFSFSKDSVLTAQVVFAGYGITVKTDSFKWDDYNGLEVKGKWVMILRGTPHISEGTDYLEMGSDDRDKAMLARDNDAGGVLFVSGNKFDAEDILVSVSIRQASVGIPVMHITRPLADSILKAQNKSIQIIESKVDSVKHPIAFSTNAVVKARSSVENIMGQTCNWFTVLKGSDQAFKDEYIVIGAHYDHLGMGGTGSSSRRPDTLAVHNGADDNASGVSAMLELAGKLKADQQLLKRSVVLVAFGAEEMGLLGSKYFVNHPTVDLSRIVAMVNLDMLGRFDTARGIQIGGAGTSLEADSLIKLANKPGNFKLALNREGSGPSDHSSFYGRNIPVFFVSTGAHTDYHTPYDDADRINIQGLKSVSDFVYRLVLGIAGNPDKLTFREAGPKESAAPGYRFKVTLGFMPDFSSTDVEGVRVDFVTKGKAAERGGIKNGDIITAIDGLAVKNIYDYMYRLSKLSKNQIISVELLRNSQKEVLIIQL